APSTLITRNGIATNASAMITAAVVNGSVIPKPASSHCPTSPRRPSTSSSATPPTTGGSTSGTVTSARTSRRPGNSTRASSQASGTPNSRQKAVATVADTSDSRSASSTCGSASRSSSVGQGARTSRPASGSTRKASPATAGTTRIQGSRPATADPVRRPAGPVRRVAEELIGSGSLESGPGQRVPALLRQHQVHELPGRLTGGRLGESGDRVVVDRLIGLGEGDALDPAAGGDHVGPIDQRGVHLTQLHLGQRGLDVLFQGDRLDGQPGRVQRLGSGGAARHLFGAERHLHLRPGQVFQVRDVGRVAGGDRDLQPVTCEYGG